MKWLLVGVGVCAAILPLVFFASMHNNATRQHDEDVKRNAGVKSPIVPNGVSKKLGGNLEEGAVRKYSKWTVEQMVVEYKRLSVLEPKSSSDDDEVVALLSCLAEAAPDALMEIIGSGLVVPSYPEIELVLLMRAAKHGSDKIILWLGRPENIGKENRSMVNYALDALATQAQNPLVRSFLKDYVEAHQKEDLAHVIGWLARAPAGGDNEFQYLDFAKDFVTHLDVSESYKSAMLCAIAKRIIFSNPEEALSLIESHGGRMQPTDYSGAIYKILTTKPEIVLRHLDTATGANAIALAKDTSIGKYLASNGRSDIAEKLLQLLPLTAESQKPANDLMRIICKSEPERAMQLIVGMPDGSVKADGLALLYANASEVARVSLTEEIGKLAAEQRNACMRNVAATVAKADFSGALALAAGASPEEQQNMYREIARTSTYQNSDNAIKMIGDPMLSEKVGPDFRAEMLNTTVQTWAKQDLKSAQQWVTQLPASDAPKGVQGLMTTWMKTDPVAASGWLSTQPAGPARDAGAQVLISQIKDTDPEMAEQWRKTLPPSVK